MKKDGHYLAFQLLLLLALNEITEASGFIIAFVKRPKYGHYVDLQLL